MPGVLGVYTGADWKGYGPLKCVVPFNNRDGSPMKKPLRPALPTDKVRFVGDPDRLRGRRNTARRPKMRPKRSWSTSSRYPP